MALRVGHAGGAAARRGRLLRAHVGAGWADAASPREGFVPIKNRPAAQSAGPAASIVSLDALAFVRFGLRAADDPRILSTLKVDRRHAQGRDPARARVASLPGRPLRRARRWQAYDGTGIGRAWPLLTGERAHYELAAGRRPRPRTLARRARGVRGDSGLLPEQVWDSADIPERELFLGRPPARPCRSCGRTPSTSKLCRSLREGRIFDRPPQTVERYLVKNATSDLITWRFNSKVRAMPTGRTLRLETLDTAVVRWSADGWRTAHEAPTRDTTLGVHVADLPTSSLDGGTLIAFRFYWPSPPAGRARSSPSRSTGVTSAMRRIARPWIMAG